MARKRNKSKTNQRYPDSTREDVTQQEVYGDMQSNPKYADAIKYFTYRLAELKAIRQTYESTWQRCMEHMAPDLIGYLNDERKDDGQRNDDVIYDGTPIDDVMICASGIWSSVSSPSRPWKRRKLQRRKLNEIQTAREWLDDVTETDYDILQASNFYQAIFSAYLHAIVVGTCCVVADPDYDTVIHYTTLNVGEYWLGVNSQGKIDSLYREMEFTGSQLIDKFGEDNVPACIKDKITDSNPTGNKYTVIHVIEPDNKGIAPFKKAYVSAYYLEDNHNNAFLQLRGYDRKNFAAYRWGVNSGETYGKFNPGRNALGDCMQLQTMVYDFHEALQKVINPPMQGGTNITDDDQIDATPGAFNKINPGGPDDTLKPLFAVNPDLQSMWQSIQDKKEQISRKFYVDLFMAVSMRQDKDMTAEEVRSIASERMLALGAALDNIHTELLGELDDILFYYAYEAKAYPVLPDELAAMAEQEDIEIGTDYISLLAQAQKMVGMSSIDTVLQRTLNMMQINPAVADNLNLDNTLEEIVGMSGAPASMLNDKKVTEQARSQRAQTQQAQETGQAALTAADAINKAGSVPDSGNLASRMMEVMQ